MADVNVDGGVFLDTNVLVAGLIDFGEQSRTPMCLFDALADGGLPSPMTAWHCCLEFFSVVTRLPEEYRLDPRDARLLLEQEIVQRLRICSLPPQEREGLFCIAVAEGLSGGRIYDAHIGETARHAGAAVLVTDNRRHFTALMRHRIRVLASAEYAAELGLS